MGLYENPALLGARARRDGLTREDSLASLLWAQRRLFLAIFAGVTIVMALGLMSLTPTYVATASLIIGEREPTINNASPAWIQKLGDPADLESQLLVIQSPSLMRLVLAAPDTLAAAQADCEASTGFLARLTGRGLACNEIGQNNEKSFDFLKARFNVNAVGRSRVLAVSYSSPSPDNAEVLANGLARAYIGEQRDISLRSRNASVQALRQELGKLERELADMEQRIQEIRSAKGLVRGATSALIAEQLTAATQQLAVAEAAEAEALATTREMSKGESARTLESSSVSQLKQQLAATTARRSSLAAGLLPGHPTLRALVAAEEDNRRAIAAELQAMAAAAQRSYETARQKTLTLRNQVITMKAQASDIAEAESQLAGLIRTADARRAVYIELSRRISDLESENLIGTSRLVNSAERPTQPSFPKRLPVLAASLTLGLVLAFAACCGRRLIA